MKKLIAYYSRADENYFGGQRRYITEGNTEKAAKMLAELTGADLFRSNRRFPMRQIMTPALPRRRKICRLAQDRSW